MSRIFQRIRQFNNAELHPYPSQYNPCRIVNVMLHPLLVWCCLLCRWGDVNIWPIGRDIPWVNEPWMLASCHIMAHTTDWVVYLVCRSFSLTSEKLCKVRGPPKLTHTHTLNWGVWSRDRCTHEGQMHAWSKQSQSLPSSRWGRCQFGTLNVLARLPKYAARWFLALNYVGS